MMFVGGVTRALGYAKGADAKGIAAFEFDESDGSAKPVQLVEGVENPTFLSLDPSGPFLNATCEIDGWNEGVVVTYAVDPASGALAYLNMQASRGSNAVHSAADRTGRLLFAVNYGVGPATQRPNRSIVVYPRRTGGEIGAPIFEATHEGCGPIASRQERPHAHSVHVSAKNRFAVAVDLGIDALMIYRFDAAAGTVEPHGRFAMPPGSGPRHLAFHPHRPIAYVVNELNSTLSTLSFIEDAGRFEALAHERTIPSGETRQNLCSEVRVSSDGGHVYAANRGCDTIARFAVDPHSGVAALVDTVPCGGETPRHFALDPSGAFLAVANQDSDRISIFRVDSVSGALSDVGKPIAVGTPTSIVFARVG
jgi:6-phosphogluconolactonase